MTSNNAKLTDAQIIVIREVYDMGNVTIALLAHKYGVDRKTIRNIVKHRTWRHLL